VYSKCCTSFFSWHWLFQLVISPYVYKLFCGLSHIFVDKLLCHYLTAKSFCPLALIKLLSSIQKTIVPIVVNTSLRTRIISYTVTGKRQVRKNILEDQIFLQTRVIGDE